MPRGTRYRRQIFHNQYIQPLNWALGSLGTLGSANARLIARMGEPATGGATSGSADIEGTRMHIKRGFIKHRLFPQNRSHLTTATTNGHLLFGLCRGTGAITDAAVLALLDAALTTSSAYASVLEGEQFHNVNGSFEIVRHKVCGFSIGQSVPELCELRFSNTYLREGEYLGAFLVPFPGQVFNSSTNENIATSSVYDVAYALQQRRY